MEAASDGDFWAQRAFCYGGAADAWLTHEHSYSPDSTVSTIESQTDAAADNGQHDPDTSPAAREPLRENSRRARQAAAAYKHVPHSERPPLLVARRNARERRRVQAVNSAFTRLRKVVPIVNARGKRVSKVKTLLTAIDYIQNLQSLLKQSDFYHEEYDIITNYKYQSESIIDFLAEFE